MLTYIFVLLFHWNLHFPSSNSPRHRILEGAHFPKIQTSHFTGFVRWTLLLNANLLSFQLIIFRNFWRGCGQKAKPRNTPLIHAVDPFLPTLPVSPVYRHRSLSICPFSLHGTSWLVMFAALYWWSEIFYVFWMHMAAEMIENQRHLRKFNPKFPLIDRFVSVQ